MAPEAGASARHQQTNRGAVLEKATIQSVKRLAASMACVAALASSCEPIAWNAWPNAARGDTGARLARREPSAAIVGEQIRALLAMAAVIAGNLGRAFPWRAGELPGVTPALACRAYCAAFRNHLRELGVTTLTHRLNTIGIPAIEHGNSWPWLERDRLFT